MKEKIGLDKTSKVIITMFIIYTIILLAIFLPPYLYRRGKLYIVSNSFKIKYVNGNWFNVEEDKEFNLRKFDIYEENSYKGKYRLLYSNKIVLLDEDDARTDYSGNIIGFSGSLKANVLEANFYESEDSFDSSVVKKAISQAEIGNVSDYEVKQKAKIDIDNDGIEEVIYNVSNNMISDPNTLDGFRDTTDSIVFSLLFIYKDNNIYIIDKKINSTGDRIFELTKLLDFRSDNKPELLYLDKYPQTDGDQCVKLYDLLKEKLIHNFCE